MLNKQQDSNYIGPKYLFFRSCNLLYFEYCDINKTFSLY